MSDLTIAMIGEGAIAGVHMDSFSAIPGVAVTQLVPGSAEDGRSFAEKWRIPEITSFERVLDGPADALVIASPSLLHAGQARAAIAAGKHVLVEIPIGMSLEECETLAGEAGSASTVVMPCHTRRFSPANRRLKAWIDSGRLSLQHLVAETYFMRRENLNMLGRPRSWTDSLLWHHAAHSIDLFQWLTDDPTPEATILAGPIHRDLGCIMDLSIALRSRSGAMMSLVMSFNNQGRFGGFYRYICNAGTYHVFRDELRDAENNAIPLTGAAFLDQNRAFVAAIKGESGGPDIASVLPSMRTIAALARQVGDGF